MNLKKIKETLDEFRLMVEEDKGMCVATKQKFDPSKFVPRINAKIRMVCALDYNMTYEHAQKEYFSDDKSLKRLRKEYMNLLELLDYINNYIGVPYNYDRYTIRILLNISLNAFNTIMTDIESGFYSQEFVSIMQNIDEMILADRHLFAETNNRNAKATDSINKYKREYGGYNVIENKQEKNTNNVLVITQEETEKKLSSLYNFKKEIEQQK